MKTNLKKSLAALAVVAGVGATGLTTVHADETSTNAFTVSPELPADNAEGASYFQFAVTPSQKRVLMLDVTNNSNKAHDFDITPAIVSTNGNGIMDYSINNTNKMLPAQLDQLVAPSKQQTISIEPKSTVKVPYTLTAPNRPFKGTMVAGFRVSDHNEIQTKKAKSTGVTAHVQYVVGLQIYNNLNGMTDVPDVQIGRAEYDLKVSRPSILLNVQNKSALIVPNTVMEAKLKDKSGKTILTFNKEHMQFAPNSDFKLNLDLADKQLAAGEYTLSGSIDNAQKSWPFNEKITVTSEKVAKVKKEAANFTPSANIPMWMYVLSAAGGLLILLMIAKFVKDLLSKNKNKKNND